MLSTGGRDEPANDTLGRHLRVLLDALERRRGGLDAVRAKLRLDCYRHARRWPAGPATLRRIGALDVNLSLDFNAVGDASEEPFK